MQKAAVALRKLDRIVLATYLVALMGLLMFPFAGPDFRLFGVESDKWMHAALFGGLAMLLRWNLTANRHAVFVSVGIAFSVATVTELAQRLTTYRSADVWDLLAGLLGAVFCAVFMDHIVSTPVLAKSVGFLVVILGLMVGAFFGLADVIDVGKSDQFGPLQMAGMALGALIVMGGVRVYSIGLRGRSRD